MEVGTEVVSELCLVWWTVIGFMKWEILRGRVLWTGGESMFKDWSYEKRWHIFLQCFLWALNCHWLPTVEETEHVVFSATLKTSLSLAEVCLLSPFPFLSPAISTVSHGSPVLFPEGALALPSLILCICFPLSEMFFFPLWRPYPSLLLPGSPTLQPVSRCSCSLTPMWK